MSARVRKYRRIGAAVAIVATAGAAALAPGASGQVRGDRSGPEIEIDRPQDGGEYERGEKLRADFECDDPSGVRLCVGTVPDGEAIPTDRLGRYSIRVVALDWRGNWSSKTHTFQVVEPPPKEEPPDDDPPEEDPPADEEPPPADPASVDPPVPAQEAPTVLPTVPPATSAAPPATRTTSTRKLPVPRLRRAASMRPAAGARLAGLRPRLRWRQERGAALYNVQVFEWRNGKWVKIRSLFPRRASVRLARALRPGRRHAWQVWPWMDGRYKRSAVRVSYFDTRPAARPRLISPRAAGVAAGRRLVLRWRAAKGTRRYTVRVRGTSRLSVTSPRTSVVLPARVLRPGALRLEILRGRGKDARPWVSRRLAVRG